MMSSLHSIQSPRECVQCLYRSSHPFGLQFNSEGLCTGCITHREKFDLDWDARFSELQRLVARLKRKNRNRHYDCVVPIRGTPEYFYVIDVLKNIQALYEAIEKNPELNNLLNANTVNDLIH